MFDFNTLADLSRTHCIAICGFLVPMNLLATVQTIVFIGLDRSRSQVWLVATMASIYALMMVFHVLTWFIIGVVMAPTYILLFLGCTCLAINTWAIAHSPTMQRTIKAVVTAFSSTADRLSNWFFPNLNPQSDRDTVLLPDHSGELHS